MPISLRIKLMYPKFLAIIFIFLMCVTTRISLVDKSFPAIDIMLIYFWCMHRPELFGNSFVFSLGLVKDLLMGIPLGVNALTNLVLRMLIMYKGDNFNSSFIIFWQGFAIVLAIGIFIKWLIFSFIAGSFVNFEMAAIQFFITVLIYPLFHGLFNLIFTILPRSYVNA